MSSSLSASIAEVAAMSEFAFRKRFRSSYESSPFMSPPYLPSRKRYQGASKLVEDSEEDEEIEESLDSDSVDDEGYGVESDGLGLEEAIPEALEEDQVYCTFEVGQGSGSAPESERPERVSAFRQPTHTTWIDPEDAGSSSRDAGGLIRDHVVRLEELSPAMFERYDRDIGELFTRSGAVRDEIFSQRHGKLAEERHARLELTEVVNGMRRGQEPKG
ncbi:hypothetical protein Tco_1472555, partial [Tanacetum coccineum]